MIDVFFRGRAAHAAFNPEDRSAIEAAARAIADLEPGRLDHRTMVNVGRIQGGTARNVVLDAARSSPRRARSTKAGSCRWSRRWWTPSPSRHRSRTVTSRRTSPSSTAATGSRPGVPRLGSRTPRWRRGRHAPRRPGRRGADANVFNARGIRVSSLPMGGLYSQPGRADRGRRPRRHGGRHARARRRRLAAEPPAGFPPVEQELVAAVVSATRSRRSARAMMPSRSRSSRRIGRPAAGVASFTDGTRRTRDPLDGGRWTPRRAFALGEGVPTLGVGATAVRERTAASRASTWTGAPASPIRG